MTPQQPVTPRRVATLGEALTVFLSTDGLPLRSSMMYRRITAGAEVNVAAAVVRLGHVATVATVVGDDPLGDAIVADVRSWGIELVARRSDRPTGMLVRTVAHDPRFDAVHLRRGAAAEDLDERDSAAAWSAGADAVFISGITLVRSASARRAAVDLAARARDHGALVVVDPNIRRSLGSPEDYAEALAALSLTPDIALGDAEELASLAGTGVADATSALLNRGCRIVVEKRGAHGAVATDARASVQSPSRSWSVVDTVGAGDAFTAGFLTAVLEGLDLESSLRRASLIAAHVVATPGDIDGIPVRREVDEVEGKGGLLR